jgi:hypothetical protein
MVNLKFLLWEEKLEIAPYQASFVFVAQSNLIKRILLFGHTYGSLRKL